MRARLRCDDPYVDPLVIELLEDDVVTIENDGLDRCRRFFFHCISALQVAARTELATCEAAFSADPLLMGES